MNPRTHITKSGNELQISEMDNNHLKNLINLLIDKLEQAKQALNGNSTDAFSRKFNQRRDDKRAAGMYIDDFREKFPYLLEEALIRNIDLSMLIQKYRSILGRESKELPAPSFDIDFEIPMPDEPEYLIDE